MPVHETPAAAFEIGTYICPVTRQRLPLVASQPISEIAWPVVVESCKACGCNHLLEYADLRHPPVFGYE